MMTLELRAVDGDDASSRTIAAGVRCRSELSPPLNSVARQLSIRTEIIFFQRKEGVGLGKGRGLAGRAVISTLWRKNGILILGRV